MFAFVGYIVQSNVVFPWPQTLAGTPHPSADLLPEAQFDQVPLGAKWQIFAVISMLELWDECGGGGALPHYTNGRKPGQYPSFQPFRDNVHFVLDLYDPLGFNKNMSAETKERRLISELNNGRLAMVCFCLNSFFLLLVIISLTLFLSILYSWVFLGSCLQIKFRAPFHSWVTSLNHTVEIP